MKARFYDVYAERKGVEYKMNMTQMNHKDACAFKKSFTPRKETRYFLKEITAPKIILID